MCPFLTNSIALHQYRARASQTSNDLNKNKKLLIHFANHIFLVSIIRLDFQKKKKKTERKKKDIQNINKKKKLDIFRYDVCKMCARSILAITWSQIISRYD